MNLCNTCIVLTLLSACFIILLHGVGVPVLVWCVGFETRRPLHFSQYAQAAYILKIRSIKNI